MTLSRTTCVSALALGAAIAIGITSPSSAREPGAGNQYPIGTGIGTPIGANPPEGFYYINSANYYASNGTAANSNVAKPGTNTTSFAESPKLMWTTPFTVLGATEMMYIAQPIVDLTATNKSGTNRGTGFADTAIFPINLSWKLGDSWNIAGVFGVLPPDGQYRVTNKVNIGDNFWTFEPEVAASYLSNGYDLSVHVVYNTNTKNTATNYTSGDQILIEGQAAKWFGKYELGVVGYFDQQISDDVNTGTTFPKTNLTHPQQVALGGLVGYDFGPLKLQGWLTEDVQATNGGSQGTRFWTKIVIPLH